MSIYLIADTHFGHKNIIEYEERPFSNIDEMDLYMITKWNEVVDQDDIVYHLGDFALCSTKRYIHIAEELNGKKILIRGNHDKQSCTKILERMGFDEFYPTFTVIEGKYVLSHRPFWDLKEGQYNIHGHKHKLKYPGSDAYKSDQHICVSVELTGYRPVKFENLININK